jgi:hypothetical protein
MVVAFRPLGNVTGKMIVEITQTKENFVQIKPVLTFSSHVKALVTAYPNHGNVTEITIVLITPTKRIVHRLHALPHNSNVTH